MQGLLPKPTQGALNGVKTTLMSEAVRWREVALWKSKQLPRGITNAVYIEKDQFAKFPTAK